MLTTRGNALSGYLCPLRPARRMSLNTTTQNIKTPTAAAYETHKTTRSSILTPQNF